MRQSFKTFLIAIILSSTYTYLYFQRNENGFATIWGVIFIFMGISLFYTSRTILITISATAIILEIYHILFIGDNSIIIDDSDHIGRIGIILLVLFVTMTANSLLKQRLMDSQLRLKKISQQKETLLALNDKLSDSEAELIAQNEQLSISHKEIDRLAYYDVLTGLPKREKLFADIEKIIEDIRLKQTKEHFTLILIDLDNFKVINDLHGHEVGDHFLVHASNLIQSLVKPYGCDVYKIGSDDYVILTNRTTGPEPVMPILNSLITNFDTPMEYELYSIRTTISIGVSDYPHSGTHGKVLLRNADIALHHAKAIGKSNYVFFDDSIEERLLRKLNLQEELKMAIENDELSLVYQPIINVQEHKIESFEALLRWTSPTYGQISPLEFIPYAEENMTIIPIGLWVLEESMQRIQKLNTALSSDYNISVNVSMIQLHSRQFLNELDDLIKYTDFNPHLLDIEVTESIFIESFDEIVQLLSTLRNLGITISLDDFGTGYSSLAYLKKLPIDHIKIDKSFIQEMRPSDNPLVESIISLAHRLHITVVAEGVETNTQLETLKHTGSDYAQGYHISRPLATDVLEAFVKNFE